MLVTRRLEIEALILVLLAVLRAGVRDYGVKWEISDYSYNQCRLNLIRRKLGLDDSVRTMRHEIANSLIKPKHPTFIRSVKDLEFAKGLLRQREAQLDQQWRDRAKSGSYLPSGGSLSPTNRAYTYTSLEQGLSLEGRLALAKEEERRLSEELKAEQKEFQELFDTAELFEKESVALQEKRDLFEAVRQRRDERDVERNVPGSISIMSRAGVPSGFYKDRRGFFTAIALVIGLGIGGLAAFLRAGRDQAIHAPKDMPRPMQVPFLGHIPEARIRRSIGKSLPAELLRIQARRVESVRLVRTTLLSRLEDSASATILVTSSAGGTGKSTFTMMLGKSLARTGKKVLMIDADLRKMTLSKRFGLVGEPGFMESLRSKSVDKRYIFPTETSGLSILSAGRPNGDGSAFEGTANGAFKACIDQLRRHSDIVLLDSSPVLAVADATILSNQVDGTIMVERELVSRRHDVVDALDRLDSTGGRLFGTVFVGSGGCEDYGYGWFSS